MATHKFSERLAKMAKDDPTGRWVNIYSPGECQVKLKDGKWYECKAGGRSSVLLRSGKEVPESEIVESRHR